MQYTNNLVTFIKRKILKSINGQNVHSALLLSFPDYT